MKADWRAIFGPALTTAVALIAFYVDRQFVTVPNPAPLFVCIVALASSLSGMASGLVSAVIAVISSALFFLHHRAVPGYDAHDIARMALLAMTAGGTAIITGMLRQKWVDAFASEQELHATSARLAAALHVIAVLANGPQVALPGSRQCASQRHDARLHLLHPPSLTPFPANQKIEQPWKTRHTLNDFGADSGFLVFERRNRPTVIEP